MSLLFSRNLFSFKQSDTHHLLILLISASPKTSHSAWHLLDIQQFMKNDKIVVRDQYTHVCGRIYKANSILDISTVIKLGENQA